MGISLNSDQIFAGIKANEWWHSASSDQIFELSGAAGTGKAQPINTVIPTPDGDKLLGDLEVGDYVFNRYGKPVKVLEIFDQGKLQAFKVTLDDGRSTICNDEHLWSYYDSNGEFKTNTLRFMIDNGFVHENGDYKYLLPSFGSDDKESKNYVRYAIDLGYETEMKCIYVDDPDHLYATNDYIVTHNTTCIKYIFQDIGLDPLKDVLFVAFTGKAATQLARNGLPAVTCHSAFYEYKKVLDRDENGKLIQLPDGSFKKKGAFVKKEELKKNYKAICIDEATMINKEMKEDILSFGIPVFALGDTNQLPPVFGDSVFMVRPNVVLRKLMRQAENDPIVYIAHLILDEKPLKYGNYGKSSIIRRSDLNSFQLKEADIILTMTNKLRHGVNDLFRENYCNFPRLDMPYVGEKVICRKNNWSKSIGDNIYLTNGLTGFIEYVDKETYNGTKIKIDFKPDFTKKVFRNINADYKTLMRIGEGERSIYNIGLDEFEFAYAITVYSSQGSQWDNVMSLAELYGSREFQKKALYTMVTRATTSHTLVLPDK